MGPHSISLSSTPCLEHSETPVVKADLANLPSQVLHFHTSPHVHVRISGTTLEVLLCHLRVAK